MLFIKTDKLIAKLSIIISFLLTVCFNVSGQTGKDIYSLTDDSLKVQLLYDLAYGIEIENPDSAIKIYELGAEISKNVDYLLGYGRGLQYKGIVLSDQGNYDKAIEYYERSIEVFKLIPYPGGVASTYVNIGNIYKRKAEYSKALNNYLEGTRVFEQIGDTSRLIYAYSNVGAVLSDVEQYDKSLQYNYRSLELSILVKDSASICDGLVNIGSIDFDMGMLDDALINFNKALKIAEKTNDIYMLYLINNSLSNINAKNKDTSKALKQSKLSLSYAKTLGNPALVSNALARMGANYMDLGKLDSANYYLERSIKIARQNQAQEVLISTYMWMAELQEKLNNTESALNWYRQYQTLQKEASGQRQKRIVAGLEMEYETEKKDLELSEKSLEIERNEALLSKRNYFIVALTGALISAFIFFFLVRRSLRQKKIIAEKDAALQQDKVLQMKKDQQVIAFKSMMEGEEKERSRLAKDLHDGLGGLLSSVKLHFSNIGSGNEMLQQSEDFKKAVELLDTTSSEARKISHNLMPGALVKFGLVEALQDFCNNISSSNSLKIDFQSFGIEKRLPEAIEIMIYRIVQELINNTVKHADANEAIVQLMGSEKKLHLTVEDNGKGFDPDKLKNPGAGINNIRSRVEFLNGILDFDSELGVGTTVNVEVPIEIGH